MELWLGAAVVLLALANGANDNFKGVATLWGGGILGFRGALAWTTVATLLGCLTAAWLAGGLASAFSGRGLVPPAQLTPDLAFVVCLAAASVVLAASGAGLPVSTTHALIGGLAGAAVYNGADGGAWSTLVVVLVLPLALSPVLSAAAAWLASRAMRGEPHCVCAAATTGGGGVAAIQVVAGPESSCDAAGARPILSGRSAMTAAHVLSAGAVSFARGLNDLPKIAGVLLLLPSGSLDVSTTASLATVMAIGGVVGSARTARTMSRGLTVMSDREGLAANAITSSLTIAASVFGMPVSTTHVACGSLAGLGMGNGGLARRRFAAVAAAWLITLPAAAAASWAGLAFVGRGA